jgi:hypothetical protein
LDDPGIFTETDATALARRFSEVKLLYEAYLAQLRLNASGTVAPLWPSENETLSSGNGVLKLLL